MVPVAAAPTTESPTSESPTSESRAPDPAQPRARPAGLAPGDRVRAIWTEILGRADVEPDSDFFDLGGDSLSAVALVGRIRDEFGLELSVGAVFDHPTRREFEALVADQS